MNNEEKEALRVEFAKIALKELAHNVVDSKFQDAASKAEMEPDELVSAYCWQIADSMIKFM
jgi:hypothetical protein